MLSIQYVYERILLIFSLHLQAVARFLSGGKSTTLFETCKTFFIFFLQLSFIIFASQKPLFSQIGRAKIISFSLLFKAFSQLFLTKVFSVFYLYISIKPKIFLSIFLKNLSLIAGAKLQLFFTSTTVF